MTTSSPSLAAKACCRCRRRKLLVCFYRNARSRDGRQSICRLCISGVKKTWRVNNHDKMSAQYRRAKLKKYGITVEQYDNKLEEQNGGCAICNRKCKTGRSLSVDHNHDTKEFRGLLCINCNIAVGNLMDNPDLARKAAEYLE